MGASWKPTNERDPAADDPLQDLLDRRAVRTSIRDVAERLMPSEAERRGVPGGHPLNQWSWRDPVGWGFDSWREPGCPPDSYARDRLNFLAIVAELRHRMPARLSDLGRSLRDVLRAMSEDSPDEWFRGFQIIAKVEGKRRTPIRRVNECLATELDGHRFDGLVVRKLGGRGKAEYRVDPAR